MNKKFKCGLLIFSVFFTVAGRVYSHGHDYGIGRGNILLASGDYEELPPEPSYPAIPASAKIKQEVKKLQVPAGKETVLDVYKVKKGDYLTRLAAREYGNSDLWEIIYSYNKYINDPHWIFPGDKIILPRIVDKLPDVPEKEPEKETSAEKIKPREYGDFLAPEDFLFDASVTGFKDDNILHSQGASLFTDLGKKDGINEDQRLYIYRKGRLISHPYTGALLGRIVEKIGEIIITPDINNNTSTARIVYSDRSVEKGDLLLFAD